MFRIQIGLVAVKVIPVTTMYIMAAFSEIIFEIIPTVTIKIV